MCHGCGFTPTSWALLPAVKFCLKVAVGSLSCLTVQSHGLSFVYDPREAAAELCAHPPLSWAEGPLCVLQQAKECCCFLAPHRNNLGVSWGRRRPLANFSPSKIQPCCLKVTSNSHWFCCVRSRSQVCCTLTIPSQATPWDPALKDQLCWLPVPSNFYALYSKVRRWLSMPWERASK